VDNRGAAIFTKRYRYLVKPEEKAVRKEKWREEAEEEENLCSPSLAGQEACSGCMSLHITAVYVKRLSIERRRLGSRGSCVSSHSTLRHLYLSETLIYLLREASICSLKHLLSMCLQAHLFHGLLLQYILCPPMKMRSEKKRNKREIHLSEEYI
jgi:hypothetical protein